MNNQGWIKTHRSLKDHDLITDPVAFTLFSVILMSVDRKTGKYRTGTINLSETIRLPRTTVRDALKRLSRKYKVIEVSTTTKYTDISVSNWSKYQGDSDTDANRPPTDRQQTATKQEVENKEIITTNVVIPKIEKPIEKTVDFPKPVTPRKGTFYFGLIQYCRSKQGIVEEFTNQGKQYKACKMIVDAGYTEDDAKFVIDQMAVEDFWKANPFDLMNVANNMHKYMNRTVMFKPKMKGKYAYN